MATKTSRLKYVPILIEQTLRVDIEDDGQVLLFLELGGGLLGVEPRTLPLELVHVAAGALVKAQMPQLAGKPPTVTVNGMGFYGRNRVATHFMTAGRLCNGEHLLAVLEEAVRPKTSMAVLANEAGKLTEVRSGDYVLFRDGMDAEGGELLALEVYCLDGKWTGVPLMPMPMVALEWGMADLARRV